MIENFTFYTIILADISYNNKNFCKKNRANTIENSIAHSYNNTKIFVSAKQKKNQKRLSLIKILIYWCCFFLIFNKSCRGSCDNIIVNGFEANQSIILQQHQQQAQEKQNNQQEEQEQHQKQQNQQLQHQLQQSFHSNSHNNRSIIVHNQITGITVRKTKAEASKTSVTNDIPQLPIVSKDLAYLNASYINSINKINNLHKTKLNKADDDNKIINNITKKLINRKNIKHKRIDRKFKLKMYYKKKKRHSGDLHNIVNTNAHTIINYNNNNKFGDLNAKMLQRPDFYDEDLLDDYDSYELLIRSNASVGMFIGSRCNGTCHRDLAHVMCDPLTFICGCDKNHPVIIGAAKGCTKAKRLNQQCHFHESCLYNDENSLCIQIKHNAMCQCRDGYHMVSYAKPVKKNFCTRDMVVANSDLPTLLGVVAGIFVLAGLICMVLHLFSKTKYPRRPFGDTNQSPTILYNSNDTGIPLTVRSGRPSSRSSYHSSDSLGSYGNRRPSSALQSGSKGILVSTSRTDSRRASLTSIHSVPSIRSYSAMRFEKELQQKEIRNEMKIRLGQLQPDSKSKDSLHPPPLEVGRERGASM